MVVCNFKYFVCLYPFASCLYAVFMHNHHEELQLYLYTPWRFSGGGGIAPLILNLNTRRARVVSLSVYSRENSYSAPFVYDVG